MSYISISIEFNISQVYFPFREPQNGSHLCSKEFCVFYQPVEVKVST